MTNDTKTAEQWELEALRAREEARRAYELVRLVAYAHCRGMIIEPDITLEQARDAIVHGMQMNGWGGDDRSTAKLAAWR